MGAKKQVPIFIFYWKKIYTRPFKALKAQDITKNPIPTVENPMA